MPHRLAPIAAVSATVLLAGCGSPSVDRDEVEEDTARVLTERDVGEVGTVECPDDLDAEVGTEMTCTAEIDGEERRYIVRVIKFEDGTADWEVEEAAE